MGIVMVAVFMNSIHIGPSSLVLITILNNNMYYVNIHQVLFKGIIHQVLFKGIIHQVLFMDNININLYCLYINVPPLFWSWIMPPNSAPVFTKNLYSQKLTFF